jgi:hypothetical protein
MAPTMLDIYTAQHAGGKISREVLKGAGSVASIRVEPGRGREVENFYWERVKASSRELGGVGVMMEKPIVFGPASDIHNLPPALLDLLRERNFPFDEIDVCRSA